MEKREIGRRIKTLRKGKPLPDMKGKTVIIVDDGIATGATLFATINLCKNHKARKIIVAAPVAREGMEETLLSKVDEVVILFTPPFYHAVSQGYSSFHNLTDEAVLEIINKWEAETKEQL
jgi:predicted phosphoribosyltransferase